MPAAALTPVEPEAHLLVRGLSVVREGRCLFRDLTFSLSRGSFLAVVGPSGAGKSSLMAALSGLIAPAAGEVLYRGAGGALIAPAQLRGRLGLVFQDLRLVPTLSLLDNVRCGRLHRRSYHGTLLGLPREGTEEAMALLQALGLEPLAYRWACDVSGGEQQRAALARALFMEPEVVLADEPVSALDVEGAERALTTLRAEARRLFATVIGVLHDPPLVERFADHVLTLDPRLPSGHRLEAVSSSRLERQA